MLPARTVRRRTSSRRGACSHCRGRCGTSRLLSYVPCRIYFAFGVFLAAPLAGAAFFVDAGSALAFAGAAFLARLLGAGGLGVARSAGFSVGGAATARAPWARPWPSAFAGAARLGRLSGLRGAAFFCCLLIADRDDLQDRVLLAVALLAAVIVAAALLEHRDLVGLGLGDDLGRDGQAVGRLEAPSRRRRAGRRPA